MDVIHDIFLRAIERENQVKEDTGAWLFAIARSQVAEYYRRRSVRDRNLLDWCGRLGGTITGGVPSLSAALLPNPSRELLLVFRHVEPERAQVRCARHVVQHRETLVSASR